MSQGNRTHEMHTGARVQVLRLTLNGHLALVQGMRLVLSDPIFRAVSSPTITSNT